MTDWRKYKSMPGVTYPPDGAPEYATDDKVVIKRPERDPAAKAKRQQCIEERKKARTS